MLVAWTSTSVMLLTSKLKWGCTGSSKSTLVNMPHCSKSHYVPWYEQSATKAWLIVVCCSNVFFVWSWFVVQYLTPGRWQSKTFLTIDERGSKIAKNSVFDCHLSPVGRHMLIENSVSNDFDLRSSIYWRFRLPPNRCVPISVIASFVII